MPPPDSDSLEPTDRITNDEQRIYNACLISSQSLTTSYEPLNVDLDAYIAAFTVEFFLVEGGDQEASFKLNFAPSTNLEEEDVVGARVSMETIYKTDDWATGACQIQLCDYLGCTPGATTAFRFPIQKNHTLRNLMDLIRNIDRETGVWDQRGDMTKFDLEAAYLPSALKPRYFHGRRDWM